MKKIILKQSRNWWQKKDLNWFIENAEFAFTNNGYKGNRVRIVTKEKTGVNDRNNCFEFDNNRYGIMITSESEYRDDWWSDMIAEKDYDVKKLLIKFLNEWGAGEFVNPKYVGIKKMFNSKDKYIEL
jgi:hypothetical protein